jgi:hypothetical protein
MARPLAGIERRLAEAEARQRQLETSAGGPVEQDLADPNFAAQLGLLNDESKLISVLCTRRAAKSFSLGKRFVRTMRKHPGCSCLYIGLTDKSSERAIWKDVLKVLDRRYGLGAKLLDSKLTMTLPNGSVLYVMGMDRDETEREKLLGGKYAEVGIDEAQSFSIDLHSLVFDVLKPAVADYRGVIGLYGTPGNLKRGTFYDLTHDRDPSAGPQRWLRDGFSGHSWSTFDNPYMADKWREEIAELKAANPLIESTPGFQQNYLGRWVIDDSKLVYRYRVGRNDFNGTLPTYLRGEWHFVLAIDLGYTDATSFTVLAYHEHDRNLYVLKSEKKPGMDLTDVSEHAATLRTRWPIEHTTIDGSNKQAVEEMNMRHGLMATPADKREKAEFIDIMNDEFIQERIKLGPDTEPLKEEYGQLVWDERKLEQRKRIEHPSCENHCADGTLYGWRWCWQYLSEPLKKPPPRVGSPIWLAQEQSRQEAELDAEAEAEFRRNRNAQRDDFSEYGGPEEDAWPSE